MLIDRTEIFVKAGKGGDGCVSFRREKYIAKGGPDGGDGGDGGSVFAVATSGVDTLLDFSGRHHWIAGNGQPGMSKKMYGRNGKDLILQLPPGTLLIDRETEVLVKDLSVIGERICIAQGGRGGRGNTRFARASHQTPREFDAGTPGEERWLRLELKLIADVGVIGLPNAGKSTLLARMSKAHPKIAGYPFTTLEPQLGIVELSDHRRFVMADMPGLIEGAHAGAGLGDDFLRHIERTRVLLHLVDVGSEFTEIAPAEAYRMIREELERYGAGLESKPEIVAGNKLDLTGTEDACRELADAIGKEVLPLSGVSGKGVARLAELVWSFVREAKDAASTGQDNEPPRPADDGQVIEP